MSRLAACHQVLPTKESRRSKLSLAHAAFLFFLTCSTLRFSYIYYTAVLNAVECPIHLNEASQRSAVNYFSITDRYYV